MNETEQKIEEIARPKNLKTRKWCETVRKRCKTMRQRRKTDADFGMEGPFG